ncbi:hypothetical protein SNOG_07670 [Parastagonospora nodorum SN15]|uniref:Mid2 domain-containing protein n=1 Tax=Phaeosphaeria nodorum (strain SN15 / ATCC MYA-4574 / FGSC 10173) TaxID=321614 RepID=Q0UKP4_PHANO|nr:hypothetical protein SNOG_07670 [Parastagonospora nodorum SN15]EAT85136.1 hypothetical protein SNOG_07670 [Parastagonospora nodorum SN15]
MHSLRGWKWMIWGGLIGSVAAVPRPIITPAPQPGVEVWLKRQEPDAASFAEVLLTAIPLSLRQIAATNAPAVSSILWREFLDDNRPQWFLNLPYDIQSYLVKEFGPETARLPTPPSQTTDGQATPTQSSWQWPISTGDLRSSQTVSSRFGAIVGEFGEDVNVGVSFSVTIPKSIRNCILDCDASNIIQSATVSSTASSTVASSTARTNSGSTPSATFDPISPPASNSELTRTQKIGLGIGISLGIFGAAAMLLGCCFLLRRRRNKHEDGSQPPSSPGFIPRFAFQDKSTENLEHRRPLNPAHNQFGLDHGNTNWEDEGYDPYESTAYDPAPMAMGTSPHPPAYPPREAPQQMTMQDAQPIMAPALFHTHSSNRARGKRTSYSSLHSVKELSEPDENAESPVLGRQTTPLQRKRRPSMPMVLEIPSVPRSATIKRKPVPESPTGISPAAEAASKSLLRPSIRHVEYSGSSSSGLALSSNSSNGAYHTDPTSPISPLSQNAPVNSFSNDYSYVEDYGPEYQNGYLDQEDGLYGGHRSLDRYPTPSPPRRSSKTEWPLRNMSIGHKRSKSPMWDRVYEG